MQFIALATFQVLSRHPCRGLGWRWVRDRGQRTFHQCRKFWSQRGPGVKASLLLTHWLTVCASLHCSSPLHVTCPNVRLSPIQVRKTLEGQSRSLIPLTAQHSQAVKNQREGNSDMASNTMECRKQKQL